MRRGLPWVVALLGLLLVVGGIALFAAGNRPADFGWTSYAPLSPVQDAYESRLQLTFDDGPAVLWTRTSAFGAGTAVCGLLVLAGMAGWGAGRRSAPTRTD